MSEDKKLSYGRITVDRDVYDMLMVMKNNVEAEAEDATWLTFTTTLSDLIRQLLHEADRWENE